MAFDVTALTDYVNQERLPLIVKAQLSAKTAQMVTAVPGIKYQEALNKLDTTVTFQANGCGFNSMDSTSLSNRIISVGDIKVNESICPKQLAKKWAQSQLAAGARGEKESMPFEQEYADLKASIIAANLETALWQGDTLSASANLNKFDGYIKTIDASGVAAAANATKGAGTVAATNASAAVVGTGTTFTTSYVAGDKIGISGVVYTILSITDATHLTLTANYAGTTASGLSYTIIKQAAISFASPYTTFDTTNAHLIMVDFCQAIPAQVLNTQTGDSVIVFMGMDAFRTWTAALTKANLYHYTGESTDFELVIPGTNIKAVAVNGLNGTKRMFAGKLSNFFYGVDLLDDEERFEIFFAKEADEIRFIAEFRAGVQVGTPEEITQFTLA